MSIYVSHCVHCGRVYIDSDDAPISPTDLCVCGAEKFPITRSVRFGEELVGGDGAKIRTRNPVSSHDIYRLYRLSCHLGYEKAKNNGNSATEKMELRKREIDDLINKILGYGEKDA